MSEWLSRARTFVGRNPRFFRVLFFAGLFVAVAVPLSRLIPRGLEVTYVFGHNHRDYDTLRVAYLPVGQDSARALTQRFPNGAPATYTHRVELAPGPYEIHARLEGESDVVEVTGYVTVGRSTRARVEVVHPRLPTP